MKKPWFRVTGLWIPVMAAALVIAIGAGSNRSSMAGDEKTYKSLKLFSSVLEEIEANYVDEVDPETLIQSAIKGMVESLDPHSSFMPPEAFDELQDDTKGEFGGIGIVISMKKGILTVISPIEGTPAYEAGIRAGDVIVSIDGTSTRDLELWESVKKMRGPRGEKVVITILREGAADLIDYTLVRDMIPMESVRSATLAPGYGYVWVTNFRSNTVEDLEKALEKLESGETPLKGLILDMRNNPGGLLDQAVEISDLFLDKGVIVSIKGRKDKHTEVFEAHADSTDRKYPMIVLINGGSASASEIVAGALQDTKRGLILGTTSFGKGSVQTVKPLKDGFGLKYTIARYYTPNGRSIQAEGIKPDIQVEYSVIEEPKSKKGETAFDRMLRERDLKNHLEPEKEAPPEKLDRTSDSESNHMESGVISQEKLNRDSQVQRALDLLKGYEVFNSRTKG
ncbi:MAG: S41 family peptidase [Pseudomonadota bacterium]